MPTYEYEMARNSFLNGFEDLINDDNIESTLSAILLNSLKAEKKKPKAQTKLDNKLSTNLFCIF